MMRMNGSKNAVRIVPTAFPVFSFPASAAALRIQYTAVTGPAKTSPLKKYGAAWKTVLPPRPVYLPSADSAVECFRPQHPRRGHHAAPARRRQRPVPLLPSPANKSLEFVKLIGTLYFQRETPTELVRKKWLYFADEVQRHTGIDLRDQATAQERASRLSEKTGMAQEDLLPLLTRLDEVLGESARRPDNEEMKRLVDRMNDVLRRL